MVTGLVGADGRVIGADLTRANLFSADALHPEPKTRRISTRSVLIAAGGAGQVYSDTTNPGVATGDGIAGRR